MVSRHLKLYILSLRAAGLLPLSLDKRTYRAQPSQQAVLYSCICGVIISTMNITTIIIYINLHCDLYRLQATLMFSLTLAWIVGLLRTFAMYSIQIYRRDECIALVNEAQLIWSNFQQATAIRPALLDDETAVETSFLDGNCRSLVHWKCASVVAQLLFITLYFYDIGDVSDIRPRFAVKLLLAIGIDVMALIYINCHFVVALLVLQFFRTINVRLSEQVQIVRDVQQHESSPRIRVFNNVIEEIDRLAVLYAKVSSFANRAMAIIAFPMILVLINSFLYLLVSLYGLVHDIGKLVDFERQDHPPQPLYNCLSAAFFSLEVYFVVWISDAVIEEAARTGRILCRTASFQIDKAIKECIEIFSLRILQSKRLMMACGMMSLDKTLLHGMVGAITSYLTILIQFDLAGNASNKPVNTTSVENPS